jgi:hypothetical protein
VSGLALWLLLIGVVDVVRGGRDASHSLVLGALAAAAAVGSLLLAVLLRPTGLGWLAWALAALAAVGWVLASGVATALFAGLVVPHLPGPVTGRRAAAVAYGSIAVGSAALLLAGPAAGAAPGLTAALVASGLGMVPPQRILLVVALLVVEISTVNLLVRLLLDLVGVPASDNEKTLRGGRVLGPMERLMILGLGAAGSLTGAAIVVAAKAILRFPELRIPRAGDPGYGGPSDVTEYFLVGSFASWLAALGAVGLVLLT